MGGEPPLRREIDEDDQGADLGETRGDWFARLLGEEWVAEGDGVYRFVGRGPAQGRVPSADAPVEELDDALASHLRPDRDHAEDQAEPPASSLHPHRHS